MRRDELIGLRVDHIGSTAIEGMDAKNVIDVQVPHDGDPAQWRRCWERLDRRH
jgi:GrpB-like predicted nucleotidyltransferase (UPF0157 family)